MNIYFLDEDPTLAAQAVCDEHLYLLIKDCYNLLHDDFLATKSCEGSMLSDWVKEDVNNSRWVFKYYLILIDLFSARFGKTHPNSDMALYSGSNTVATSKLKNPPPRIMQNQHLIGGGLSWTSVVSSYRHYYCWKNEMLENFNYVDREKPTWIS